MRRFLTILAAGFLLSTTLAGGATLNAHPAQNQQITALEARVDALEARVRALELAHASPTPTANPTPTPTAAPTPTPTPAPTAAPTAAPTPSPTPSGGPPTGDLPGWDHIFADNFDVNAIEGGFLQAYPTWSAYPLGWNDSSGHGTYDPSILSVHDGFLDVHIRTTNGVHRVASFGPRINGVGNDRNQLYGRYAIRFRTDAIVGYKGAWLTWPQSEIWPRDGEIDFPEGDFDRNIEGYVHRQGATSGGDQYAFTTNVPWAAGWHTAIIEWKPASVEFFLDGVSIGLANAGRIPNTPMRWQIQNETRIISNPPPDSSSGHINIDWVSVWRYVP